MSWHTRKHHRSIRAIRVICGLLLAGFLLFLLRISDAASTAAQPPATLPSAPAVTVTQAAKQKVVATYAKLPLRFEANQGQTDPQVKFIARGNGYSLFLTLTEAVLSLIKEARRPYGPPP